MLEVISEKSPIYIADLISHYNAENDNNIVKPQIVYFESLLDLAIIKGTAYSFGENNIFIAPIENIPHVVFVELVDDLPTRCLFMGETCKAYEHLKLLPLGVYFQGVAEYLRPYSVARFHRNSTPSIWFNMKSEIFTHTLELRGG